MARKPYSVICSHGHTTCVSESTNGGGAEPTSEGSADVETWGDDGVEEGVVVLDPPCEIPLFPLGYNPFARRRRLAERGQPLNVAIELELEEGPHSIKVLLINLQIPTHAELHGRVLIDHVVSHLFVLPAWGNGSRGGEAA